MIDTKELREGSWLVPIDSGVKMALEVNYFCSIRNEWMVSQWAPYYDDEGGSWDEWCSGSLGEMLDILNDVEFVLSMGEVA